MADIELLPLHYDELPEVPADIVARMQSYARANVAHATAPLQAENERLRAEVERLKRHAERQHAAYRRANRRAERLKERDALARRFEWLRENPHVRVDQFGGKYRASTAAHILTDWLPSYDEAIDAAIAAANGSS